MGVRENPGSLIRQETSGTTTLSLISSIRHTLSHSRTTTDVLEHLPMLPKDLEIIMQYLNSEEAIQELRETKHLYFKAFVTMAFSLWTQ